MKAGSQQGIKMMIDNGCGKAFKKVRFSCEVTLWGKEFLAFSALSAVKVFLGVSVIPQSGLSGIRSTMRQ